MPVNYEQLRPQIKQAGISISAQREERTRQQSAVFSIFSELQDADELRERMSEILLHNAKERCAEPESEPIGAHFPCPRDEKKPLRLLACDGSQINPNRHEELTFGLLNTAVIEYLCNTDQVPRIITKTTLLDFADQAGKNTELQEDQIAVRRDAAEKRMLADIAAEAQDELPTIALTDGPLELFMDPSLANVEDAMQREYREALARLAALGTAAAGYIDRPRANLVVRMLDLLHNPQALEGKVPESYALVCDADLFSGILAAGERSAIFGLHSNANEQMPEQIRLSFFYLNVGKTNKPYICRVEIPAWTAENPAMVDSIHLTLLAQNQMLPNHPYPFVLHRAHECALVTFAEKDQVKDLLMRELLSRGQYVNEKSNKQFAKDAAKIQ